MEISSEKWHPAGFPLLNYYRSGDKICTLQLQWLGWIPRKKVQTLRHLFWIVKCHRCHVKSFFQSAQSVDVKAGSQLLQVLAPCGAPLPAWPWGPGFLRAPSAASVARIGGGRVRPLKINSKWLNELKSFCLMATWKFPNTWQRVIILQVWSPNKLPNCGNTYTTLFTWVPCKMSPQNGHDATEHLDSALLLARSFSTRPWPDKTGNIWGFHKWWYPKIGGLEWKIPLKRMIWGYPHSRKPPYEVGFGLIWQIYNNSPIWNKINKAIFGIVTPILTIITGRSKVVIVCPDSLKWMSWIDWLPNQTPTRCWFSRIEKWESMEIKVSVYFQELFIPKYAIYIYILYVCVCMLYINIWYI